MVKRSSQTDPSFCPYKVYGALLHPRKETVLRTGLTAIRGITRLER